MLRMRQDRITKDLMERNELVIFADYDIVVEQQEAGIDIRYMAYYLHQQQDKRFSK